MANAEGQGKTIALVFFVLAFIGCATTTYLFYDKVAAAEQRATASKGNESKAKDALALAKANYMELRRNVVSEENIEDHASAIQLIDQQRQFPRIDQARIEGRTPFTGEPAYPAKNTFAHYQDAMTYLQDSLNQNDQRIAELENQKRDVEGKVKQVEDDYNARSTQARGEQASKNKELSDETSGLLAELKAKEQALDSATERYNQKVNEVNIASRVKLEEEERLRKIKLGLEEIRAEKEEMAQLRERLRFDSKDGTIVRLRNDGEQAEIDLGQADGLRTGLAFGIFGRDPGGNANELPKAFLEISRVVGPHRSSARISGETIGNPVLPGDVLANPIWSPGDKEGVAFIGNIDLDSDGLPDNEKFRRLIAESGGKIDSELHLKSLTTRGEITIRTGWLIVGDVPDPSTAKTPEEAKTFEAMQETEKKFRQLAGDHAVRISNVRNYLNYLSYNVPDTSILPDSGGTRDVDTSSKAVSGSFTGQTYRPRQ